MALHSGYAGQQQLNCGYFTAAVLHRLYIQQQPETQLAMEYSYRNAASTAASMPGELPSVVATVSLCCRSDQG